MILIISPAKTLDLSEETRYTSHFSLPTHLEETQQLVGVLAEMEPEQIGELMSVSPKLARLNYERYQAFSTPFDPSNAKQALLTFNGDVYTGFDLESYGEEEFEYAQAHLRILSGLYGLLRPLDLMQPYRLEMGTKFAVGQTAQLYQFWQEAVTDELSAALADHRRQVIVNCASREYARVIDTKRLAGRMLTISFKQRQNNTVRTVAIHAKRARGRFVDWLILNRIDQADDLAAFDHSGYRLSTAESSDDELVFITDAP